MENFDFWRGRWALITGASSGIGSAFAEELALGGTNLVLTARRKQRLTKLAKAFRAAHHVRVEVVAADLLDPNSPSEIFAFTEGRGIPVDLLVNNAGFGTYGEFRSTDVLSQLGMVQVNCAAVVHLVHLYLPRMVERKAGGILIVSSTAAYQAVPYMATYGASKAFDLLFAEALAREVENRGVNVCALCPGPTASEFQKIASVPEEIVPGVQSAADVVRAGLRALAAGEHSVILGFANWIGVQLQRVAPRRLVTSTAELLMRPPQGR